MKNRTCIIIDDERFARDLIEDYLKKYPEIKVVGKFKNTALALEVLQSNQTIDIVFLDIQMPNETGLEFLKRNTINQKVVFTTAYAEHALESYNLNVADYLLKPITEDRFDQTIQKLQHLLDTEEKAQSYELLETSGNNYIKIKSNAEIHKIYFNELIRLEADGEYVKYMTSHNSYYILGSLKKLSTQLPPQFAQVHRSHIIGLNNVRGREKYTIILNDFTQIPIGKTYRTTILQQLKELGI